jgi:hypothetical protein
MPHCLHGLCGAQGVQWRSLAGVSEDDSSLRSSEVPKISSILSITRGGANAKRRGSTLMNPNGRPEVLIVLRLLRPMQYSFSAGRRSGARQLLGKKKR